MTSIKYTFRLWRKNVVATFRAALAMAFGIGLVSTQFSFMNGVLLRGLPFEDADRLVYLERLNPRMRPGGLEALGKRVLHGFAPVASTIPLAIRPRDELKHFALTRRWLRCH